MFSLTILLYALVSNTFIGCLLQKSNNQETKNRNVVKILSRSQVNSVPNGNCTSNDTTNIGLQKLDTCKPPKTETDYKNLAAIANTFAKYFFAIAVLLFNAGFWAYAISQYIE